MQIQHKQPKNTSATTPVHLHCSHCPSHVHCYCNLHSCVLYRQYHYQITLWSVHIHLFPNSFWPVVEVQHDRTLLVVFQGTSLILRKSSSQNGERSLRCCSEGCNRDTNYAHANQSLARWQSRTTAVRGKFYMWQRSSYVMEEHLLSNHERL